MTALQPTEVQEQWLLDIAENVDRIERYLEDLDLRGFESDEMVRDAVERCLQRITEAVFRLGESVEQLLPDQDTKGLRGLGNFLRHKYDRVDAKLVWEYVTTDAPALRAQVLAVIDHKKGTP